MSTVYLLRPLSDAGRVWVDEHVQSESYQQAGTAVVVGHRYIDPVVEAMIAAGLELDEDFEVTEG